MRLYGTIAAAAVALLALICFRVPAVGVRSEAAPAVREAVPESAAPQPPAQP